MIGGQLRTGKLNRRFSQAETVDDDLYNSFPLRHRAKSFEEWV